MSNPDNNIIVITGASSGIGAALAKAFSTAGDRVVLCARRRNRLEQVATQCPGKTLLLTTDVTNKDDRRAIVEKTMKHWGRVDVLVNNAGLGAYGYFMDSTEADWRRLFEVNLFSPVFLTQEVIPVMQAQGGGTIVNIASIGALIAHSDKVTAYVASKHALLGFSRGLARDLEGTGINVLAVCPHLTDTEFFSASHGAQDMAPVLESIKSYMDSPQQVAEGIINQLDSKRLVVFPTDNPAKVYQKQRDI